jgi:hypothetical protein
MSGQVDLEENGGRFRRVNRYRARREQKIRKRRFGGFLNLYQLDKRKRARYVGVWNVKFL